MTIYTDMNSKPKALVAAVCRDFGGFSPVIIVQAWLAREEGPPQE